MIQFIGLTTHVAFERVHEMIETGGFDQVLLARGYFKNVLGDIIDEFEIQADRPE